MARIKATVRRFPAAERRKGKQIRPFKIKEILPQQKTVVIKKNGQAIRTIRAGRKSRYFSGKNRLIF